MLQDVTMHHPYSGILDSQPPRAPAGFGVLGLFVRVSIDIRRIAEDRAVACQLGFVGSGVVSAVAGADIVEVGPMGVPGVVVEAVVVVDVGGFVVDDYFEDLGLLVSSFVSAAEMEGLASPILAGQVYVFGSQPLFARAAS